MPNFFLYKRERSCLSQVRLVLLFAFLLALFFAVPCHARDISIHWELERGFRFFRFNSDFELQRLGFRTFHAKHLRSPTVVELDAMLNDLNWWYTPVEPKIAAWYGQEGAVTPLTLLKNWRQTEIAAGRLPGYLELSLKLKAAGLFDWEYHPVRLGWASNLFPAHQSPRDIGRGELIDASKVDVCWNRAAQRHSNCDTLDPYIEPAQHAVAVRAVDDNQTRLLSGNCKWILEDSAALRFIAPTVGAQREIVVPCRARTVVSIAYGSTASIRLEFEQQKVEPAKIKIDDVLVIGLGDSFASGEGNPDVPVKLAWSTLVMSDPITAGDTAHDQTTSGPVRKRAGDYFASQWIDRSCHRSAYSFQLRSALHLALSNSQRAITFLGYSCSGAEINEGLLFPFQGPEYSTNKDRMPAWQRSQIPLLLSELCEKYQGGLLRSNALSKEEEGRAIRMKRYRLGLITPTKPFDCNGSPKRKADLVYLSIGGNDLGFSSWILAAIAGEGQHGAFLPGLGAANDPQCVGRPSSCSETSRRLAVLRARYNLLREIVDGRIGVKDRGASNILVYAYPLPITGSNNEVCPAGNAGITIFGKQGNAPGPTICLREAIRGRPVLKSIAAFAKTHLNGELAKLISGDADAKAKWLLVDSYLPQFDRRSYCASKVRENSGGVAPAEPTARCMTAAQARVLARSFTVTGKAAQETLHLPIVGAKWRPMDPILDYRAYHHRSRLLRTMNETHFVVNQLTATTQSVRGSGILSLKDAAVYGAFHPTAEGHAIVAEAFFKKSEETLALPEK